MVNEFPFATPQPGKRDNLFRGRFPFWKKPGNFWWGQKWNFRLEKVVPFGLKPRYVAVPDRGPGTGTNHGKRKWNTTFRSEIPTGKTGPPLQIFHFFREFSSGTSRPNVFHLPPNQKFRNFD